MDASSDCSRPAYLQEGGPGRDAADQGRHSGVALACGFGVGLHDFRVRAHNRSRFEWTRFCRRCQRRRFVLFPGGIPHSIQGLGPDGCQFLLVFNDGNIDELPGPEKKNSGAVLNVFNPLQWCFNRLIPARSPHSEVNVSPRMEVPDQGFISSK